MAYDARDRLIKVTAPGIYFAEVYEYDPLDNVRRMASPNGMGGYWQDYYYTYSTSNQRLDRINEYNGSLQWDFDHNGLGETISRTSDYLDSTWNYQWNAAGRMVRAERTTAGNRVAYPLMPIAELSSRSSSWVSPDGLRGSAPSAAQTTWETYVYDAHGHRTRSNRSDGSSRYQVYSRAGQLLYVEDTKDYQRIDYIHLGEKLIAERSRPLYSSTATVTYHHTDHIGSANVETNAYGSQTERTFRMPYGSPYDGIYREGRGYAGHVTDTQTNLTYMQQRYYDPVALRFLSPDPVDVSATTGGNFNRYWYGNNNPYRFVDPDGREVRIVGSDEFVKRIESQITAADTASPKIAEMTRALRASPYIHEIRDLSESPINTLQSHNVATDPSSESNGVGTGSVTYMNPTKTTSGDGVKSSPTENLVHELTHAFQNDTGTLPDRNLLDPMTGNPASEQQPLDMQNEYRRGIGETRMREKY